MALTPAELADLVVARSVRNETLEAFLADVVVLVPTRAVCESVLAVLDATADGPRGPWAEAARRLRLADLGAPVPLRAPAGGVVSGRAELVGLARSAPRRD